MRAAGDTTVAVGDMSGFATTMGSGVTTYSLTSDVTYSFSEETPYRLPAPASSGRSWIITSADAEDTKSLTLSGGDYLASVYKGGSDKKFIITNLENFSVSGYNGGYSAYSSTWGGIFYSDAQRQEIHLTGNSGAITFSGNKVEKEMTGGKPQYTYIRSAVLNIDGFNSKLLIEDNGGAVTFENNIINFSSGASGYTGKSTSQVFGAAINLRSGTMSLSSNTGGVVFKGNSVENATGTVEGGAVILAGAGTIAMNDNAGGVSFQGNSARSTWSYMAADSTTTNTTSYYVGGGAVSAYNTNSFIEISGNSPMQGSAAAVSFSGNVLEAAGTNTSVRGGAIIASNLSISGNHGGVEFLNNHASSLFEGVTEAPIHVCGGAIYMGFSNTASICNNEGPITIQGNWAAASSTTDVVVRGGFFSGTSDSIVNLASLEISGNQGDIDISGNYVRAMRAATAEVSMTDSAALGGAIFASNLTLKNNTCNVTFRKNYEVTTNRTILRSVVASTLDISADAGKSITFYDSVYSSGVASFNAFGNGSVIFTGETTQADLREVKGGTTIWDAEIAASRTSVFKGLVDVQGGKLEVRSGAVLQGVGMSVAGDAAVSLLEGSITHTGEAAFESGSMLEVVGVGNVLTASTLEFAGGSTLKFVYGEGLAENAALTFTGTLSLAESAVIQLSGFAGHTSTAQQLISMQNSTLQGWNTGTLTFVDETGAALDASHFVWENDVLYYKTGPATLTWNNAAGDGKWNNISANWTTGDASISSTEQEDVIFGSNENTRETVTLEGELTVRNMTVQQGGNYAYTASTAGASLTLESLTVESGATADIQLGSGALNANQISSAGTVTISGDSLNLNVLEVSAGTTTLAGSLSVAEDATLVVTGGGILQASESASIDVQGTLDLSQFTYENCKEGTYDSSNKGIITVFNAISGTGTVLLKSGAEIQTEVISTGVNLAANYKVAGDAATASLAFTSWADKTNKTWRTWTVGAGGSLTVGDAGDGTLSMLAGQRLQVVDGGELKVGTLNLGYGDISGNKDNPGSLLMSGDASKVTLNHIHIQNGTENWLNDITITGGTLKVTGTEAVTYATGTNIARTSITIGGTEGQTVTLQTGSNDWTLTRQSDAASTLTVGDVTIDAANTGMITFSGATLNGTVTNNSRLALSGKTTVAAGTQATVSGSGLLKVGNGLSLDVQGTLDLSGCEYSITDIDNTTRNKQMALLFNAISGSGTVLLKNGAEIQTQNLYTDVTFAANYKVAGDAWSSLILTGWRKNANYNNDSWRTWTVGTGGSLTVGDAGDGTLSMLAGQRLQVVDGGELKVGTLNLGYGDISGNKDNPGSLLMSGDASKVTLNHIHIQNGTENWLNDITITGGTLKVTGTEAVTYATGTNIARTNITIGGTEGQTVTLQTGSNDWTLTRQSDAASTLTVGDVTIDAANTGTITLVGATLTGTITNNARLALGSGVTVDEGKEATIGGSRVQLDATLTSAGTLNLNTDAIYLSDTLKDIITTGGTVSYTLGDENGFQSIDGVNYYLSTNGNVIAQKATTATLHETSYELKTDTSGGQYNGGLYITLEAPVTTSDFYISSGTVTVDSAVHKAASRYYLRGGTMLIDKNLSVKNSSIDRTEGDASIIQLSDGASLMLDSEANGLNVTNLLSGKLSAVPAAEGATPTGRLIISSAATLAGGFTSTFTGAVELQNSRLTMGTAPAQSVNVSSISDFILNGTSEIYYHANPTQDVDIRKITVQSGTGSLRLHDSNGSPMVINEVAVERGATFNFVSDWHDSAMTVNTLRGSGKFLAESADETSAANPSTTIASLSGFTGDLEFVKDTDRDMTVVVQTGTGEALSFNSLTATNLNGAMNFTFNVQRNTTVQTLTAAAGTVSLSTGTTLTLGDGVNASTHSIGTVNAAADSTIHLNADATLHAFTKASGGSAVKLDGSGTLDIGDATKFYDTDSTGNQKVNADNAYFALADGWKGTVSIQNAIHQEHKFCLNLDQISNADSAVALTNVNGWFIGTMAGKLILNTDQAGNPAWTISDGSSKTDSMITLGAIDGAGSIYYGWSVAGTTGMTINGDVSTWTGSFMMDTANPDTHFHLKFSDAATSVKAIIGSTGDNTARLHLKTGSNAVTFNETVDAYTLTTGGAVTFCKDATVQSDATLAGSLCVQTSTTTIGGNLSASGQTVTVDAGAGLILKSDATVGAMTLNSGASLTLGDGANTSTHSIGTVSASGNTITLETQATLNRLSNVTGTVNLAGSGVYDLGQVTSLGKSSKIPDVIKVQIESLQDEDWTGTVRLHGTVAGAYLNYLGNASSWVEIAGNGLSGYLNNSTLNVLIPNISLIGDLVLTSNQGYDKYKFTGDYAGSGAFKVSYAEGERELEFAGDVADWTGEFTQTGTGTTTVKFTGAASEINTAISNAAGTLNMEIATTSDATLSRDVSVSRLQVSNTATLAGESNTITAGNVEISRKDASLSNVMVQGNSISAADTADDAKGSLLNSLVRLQAEASFTIENMVLTNTTVTAASSATEVKLKNVEGSTARLTMGAFTLDATPQVEAQAGVETRGSLSYTNGLAVSGDSAATLTLNLDVPGAVEKYGAGTYDLTITLSGYGSDFVLPENIASLVRFDTTSWLYKALVSQHADFGASVAAVSTLAAEETKSVPTVQYAAGTGDNVGSLVITISGLNVPEPATSTLGLLALAALAARRRRK